MHLQAITAQLMMGAQQDEEHRAETWGAVVREGPGGGDS